MSTRQVKYPETDTFHYVNVNPKGRLTSDCAVRAISLATNTDYKQVVMDLTAEYIKSGYAFAEKRTINEVLKSYGWEMQKQPKKEDGKKYTGEEFCRILNPNENYVISIGGHHLTAVVNNKINDTWDCSEWCVGNYWVRKK